jgi:DNA topoisomerase-1
MVPEEVTLDEALRLLTLPRKLGRAPEGGEEIVVDKGRYGPYVRKGTDYRSLETDDQLFTVTLEEAVDLFSRPRTRGNRQATQPLAEIGADPVSGAMITVKEGRFGPYVTDGTVNASLRRGDAIESLTLERAAELLADRRARAESEAAAGGRPTRGRTGRAAGTGTRSARPAGASSKARSGTKAAPARKAAAPARKASASVKKAAGPAKKAAGAAKKAAGPAKKATAKAKKTAGPALRNRVAEPE